MMTRQSIYTQAAETMRGRATTAAQGFDRDDVVQSWMDGGYLEDADQERTDTYREMVRLNNMEKEAMKVG